MHSRLLGAPRCSLLPSRWRLRAQAQALRTAHIEAVPRAAHTEANACKADEDPPAVAVPGTGHTKPAIRASQAEAACKQKKARHADRGDRPQLRRTATESSFICPACGNTSYLLPALWRHLQRCCPDLWTLEELQATDAAAVRELLHTATAREAAQRQTIVRSFRDTLSRTPLRCDVLESPKELRVMTEAAVERTLLPVMSMRMTAKGKTRLPWY